MPPNEIGKNTNFCFQDGGGIYKGKQQVMSSSATLTINVIDTQDTPPVFVGTPYFGYVYEVSSPVSIHRNTLQTDLTWLKSIGYSSINVYVCVIYIYSKNKNIVKY